MVPLAALSLTTWLTIAVALGSVIVAPLLAGLVVVLASADHQLALLNADIELIAGKSGHCQGDAQPLRIVFVAREPLDIVGRITVRSLCDAVEHALNLVETQEKGAGKGRNS